jgi:hypothetical protein
MLDSVRVLAARLLEPEFAARIEPAGPRAAGY